MHRPAHALRLVGAAWLLVGSGLLAAPDLASAAAAADRSAPGTHEVETLEFAEVVDGARGRPVPIKVHLPRGGGRHAVVLVSHGGGGHWDANFAQARHLASHGYAVLALEHVGSNTAVLRRGLRPIENLRAMTRDATEVLGRPKDLSFALDQAARWDGGGHERLRGRLDLARVGVMGHSYGAYTVLAVAGARPALDWLEPPVPAGTGLGPSLRDERVRCGVVLSPQGPGEPFFVDASFASIAVPVLAISGSRDRQQGAEAANRREGFERWPAGGHVLLWLADADHLAFSDATGSGRRMLPSPTRADVQPLVRAATLAFFDACLGGDADARAQLAAPALRRFLRGRVDAVEVIVR